MKIKLHPIEIDPTQPFAFDLLNRKEEIENLTLLINNLNSPVVISINSGWGTGKTTFIKMWNAHLKSQGLYSLYFNAWKTDFAPDPLIAFLGEMDHEIKKFIQKDKKLKTIWNKTKKLGSLIAKRGIPALVKASTAGVIDAERIVEEEAAKFAESFANDAIQTYESKKLAIESFRDSLQEIIALSHEKKSIVVFVDELDRCRPNYALDLLERIKHLFDIEGLIFILAIDRAQLNHSVRSIYGSGMDADGYLRRFIDIDYTIKKPEIEKYVYSLTKSLDLENFFQKRSKKYQGVEYDFRNFLDAFCFLAELFKFSLRDVEQTLSRVMLVFYSGSPGQAVYPELLTYLIILRDRNPSVYRGFFRKEADETNIVAYLHSLMNQDERLKSKQCAILEGFLIAAKHSLDIATSPLVKKYNEMLESGHVSELEKVYIDSISRVINSRYLSRYGIDLEAIFNRIEILKQFQFPEE